MAQIPYRANLSAAIFPMTLARSGRSVIIPQTDQNFNRSIDSPDDSNRDAGIPQIIYGENILPTADGYQSVGYRLGGSLPAPPAGFKYDALTVDIPDSGYKNIQLEFFGGGFYSSYNGFNWTAGIVVGSLPVTFLNPYSTATVRGVCYVQVSQYLYIATFTGVQVTLTEVTASVLPVGFMPNVINICGSYNYLIALKDDGTVFWSSTTTPTDFTPSLVSGAGSGTPNNAAGKINFLRTTPFGFYAYCAGNVLAGSYTGNSRYPFRFVPVESSEGVSVKESISGEPTDAIQVLVSSSGFILQLSNTQASIIAQEVNELLQRIGYEDVFDYNTNTFTVQARTQSRIKITYLMDRFIVLSFIDTDQAIVYDTMFKRYGKFNVPHTTVIDLDNETTTTKRNIIFIDEYSGSSWILSQDINDPLVPHRGVIVLGKFQYVRSRFLCLDEISVESSQLTELVPAVDRNFELYTIATLDGKTFLPVETPFPVTAQSTGAVQTYYSHAEGKNVSLLAKGNFDLCSVEMLFHLGGKN